MTATSSDSGAIIHLSTGDSVAVREDYRSIAGLIDGVAMLGVTTLVEGQHIYIAPRHIVRVEERIT